ncbi:MAG: hypothetical protein RJB57_980, partial [Actinomycetota bacterium]
MRRLLLPAVAAVLAWGATAEATALQTPA